jgi:DNA polymerase elongation subunit (family B)
MSYISTKIHGNEVLVWERNGSDGRSYTTFDAPYYFYIDDVHGKFTTMYNTSVSKVSFNTSKEAYQAKQEYKSKNIRTWESDIGPDLRVLSNSYYGIEAPTLTITHLDIETAYDKIKGYGHPKDPFTSIISCALYHEHTNEMIALVTPPKQSTTNWTNELLAQACHTVLPIPTDEYSTRFEVCADEKELLLHVIAEIEDSDILDGWNCIPTNQSIWTDNKIIKIKDVYNNQLLLDSSIVEVSPITTKPVWNITLATGQSIQSSGEHRFFVHQALPHTHIDFNKPLSELELTPSDMVESDNVSFLELTIRTNAQPDNVSFSCDQLYLAGLIYADGILKTKGCLYCGFVIYQPDTEMLERLPLLTTSIVGPYNDNYSREVTYNIIADATALIYDNDQIKQLNVELLSTLSYTQFMSFLSGLLDGDGYISHNTIEWCNINNDVDSLFEVCLWNGIFSTIIKNSLRLMVFNYSDLTLLNDRRWGDIQPTHIPPTNHQRADQTKYKIIGDRVFIRVCKIEQTTTFVDMMDIETNTHWYYSKGIKTHNSTRFDFPYLAGRIKLVLGEHYLRYLSFPEGDKTILEERQIEQRLQLNATNVKSDEDIDEDDLPATILETQMVLETSGRLLADYMLLYKKYEAAEKPSYKLSAISDDVLVDDAGNPILPKLEYDGSLMDLYTTDLPFFVRYNIRDVEILHGFEKKLGYIDVANKNYHLSCGQFKHVLGTLKLAELAITNHCHHVEKKVVQNNTPPPIDRSIEGALVLLPRIGLHSYVGSIDIKSLYPSVIMLINMSNETIIGQFDEESVACIEISNKSTMQLTFRFEDGDTATESAAIWHKTFLLKNWAVSGYGTVFNQNFQGIIPAVLTDWFGKRITFQKLKKQAENDHNHDLAEYYDRLQYVYKIKLNSLYGGLSNIHFRFYDLRLGESTTGTGRMILRHQCRKANEILEGEYNIDFPMYDTTKTAIKKGYPIDVALDGPKFNGKYQTQSIVYGDSVTGDTQVVIGGGLYVNIETLFITPETSTEDGREYYHPVGVSTLSYDELDNVSCYKPIKYVMRHKANKTVYRVWINNTQYVDVTEDHSLIGYVDPSVRKLNESPLRSVKPTEIGNEIQSVIYLKSIPRPITNTLGYEPVLYELFGFIIGAGHVEKRLTGGIGMSIGSSDIDEIRNKLLQPLIQLGYITSWFTMKHGHDVRICGVKLLRIARTLLYKNGVKTFPVEMFNETPDNISAFIRGYFTAAGTVTESNVVLDSINNDFIINTQQLLFQLGISSTVCTETTENSIKCTYSNTFTNRLIIKNNDEFKDKVGFILDRKHNGIPKTERTYDTTSMYDFSIATVTKIEKIEYSDYVYDIEVEDTHTFFANNILVHNTDSSYFETGAEDIDCAVMIADEVANQVNDSFPNFVQNTFLVDDQHKHMITTSREIVSDRGIFVEKKRYILHLVDVEGKRVDKLKVMGLDTKKTTLPAPVAKQLNKFIERFLKGETWEEVSISVVEYKDTLFNTTDIMSIGLPKGINKVEKYTEDYAHNSKCRLPGHVQAAIHYNICLVVFGDRISLPIVSGMKIKVFRLRGKHQGRFTSIAIPTDAEFIPDWFLREFIIDTVAHVVRLVDKPLSNILKAIKETPPTRERLLVDVAWDF